MFPEVFVRKHLVWSKPGDLVLDPFSGRGTTAFESILNGRAAIAMDINPVAICVSRAKTYAPYKEEAIERLVALRQSCPDETALLESDEFFSLCFHRTTLRQLGHLRQHLDWMHNQVDCFLAALCLGCLHGESHRSPRYFSNRMPRTISTKPGYSVRWWKSKGCCPPERDVFSILNNEIEYRLASAAPTGVARIELGDVRDASSTFSAYKEQVSLVITSPPYLDTTNFMEDQWLRLWMLGGPDRPANNRGDHRHYSQEHYWTFLSEAWEGIGDLLKQKATLIIRLGGSKLSFDVARDRLTHSLETGLARKVALNESRVSDIVGGQLRSFSPNAKGIKVEFDFRFSVA